MGGDAGDGSRGSAGGGLRDGQEVVQWMMQGQYRWWCRAGAEVVQGVAKGGV